MTLNILFFTVTIRQRKVSMDDALRNEMAREAYENMKNRALTVHRLF
ncbi:YrzI family small protein [Robertmurraya yapensis]|uniref:YrzI family small protein n=2 Tax=Bacillaceae TaxID=186817 RepID=A0A3S0K4D4_9BACI|nr:YrzI family small protein [Bacillus yapensis]RTR35359.1 YrzI family small protein [Bacillus yapensis]TKS97868.1 YrzI family small protein [Bacillus yapensis]